jgi:hypothetical protein
VKGYNTKDTIVILDTLPFPTGIQFADSMIGQVSTSQAIALKAT